MPAPDYLLQPKQQDGQIHRFLPAITRFSMAVKGRTGNSQGIRLPKSLLQRTASLTHSFLKPLLLLLCCERNRMMQHALGRAPCRDVRGNETQAASLRFLAVTDDLRFPFSAFSRPVSFFPGMSSFFCV
jgi:hypothetical protein